MRRIRSKLSAVASAKTKPEHTACRSKAAPWVMPSSACTATAVAGKVLSGVEVASTIRSIACASMPACASAARAAWIAMCEVNSPARGDVALVDAGALHDPFVGGVDLARQFGVGQDLARQIAAAAEHDRTAYSHEAAPPSAGAAAPCPAAPSVGSDLGQELVADHAIAKLDGGGKAFGVGSAVAFDDDAVEAEKDAAIGLGAGRALAQLPGTPSARTDSRSRAPSERLMALRRYSPIWRAVPSAVLSAMLPAKPSVTTTSTVPLPMSSPSTKPTYSRSRQLLLAQDAAGLAHLLEALDFLDADIEQADGRPLEAEQDARDGRAHHRQIDQMLGVARRSMAPTSSTTEFAAQRRPQRRDRRPLDARQAS